MKDEFKETNFFTQGFVFNFVISDHATQAKSFDLRSSEVWIFFHLLPDLFV